MNASARYLEVQVATASPERLVLMCLDGSLRFIRGAREALSRGEKEEAHRLILRAQEIVAELKGSLDLQYGELPRRLYALYDFLQERLVEANIQKEERFLGEAERVLVPLRDAWREVAGGRTA